jgi:hypothetical protein
MWTSHTAPPTSHPSSLDDEHCENHLSMSHPVETTFVIGRRDINIDCLKFQTTPTQLMSITDLTSFGMVANCGHKFSGLRGFTLIYRSGHNVLGKMTLRQKLQS